MSMNNWPLIIDWWMKNSIVSSGSISLPIGTHLCMFGVFIKEKVKRTALWFPHRSTSVSMCFYVFQSVSIADIYLPCIRFANLCKILLESFPSCKEIACRICAHWCTCSAGQLAGNWFGFVIFISDQCRVLCVCVCVLFYIYADRCGSEFYVL